MEVRHFDSQKDYQDVCVWWKKHKWNPMPLDFLPTLGRIVEDEENKYSAGWLYSTDSKICLLEFVISNPDSNRKKRSESVDILIKDLIQKASELGFGAVVSSIRHPVLLHRYKKQGFEIADERMTNVMRII